MKPTLAIIAIILLISAAYFVGSIRGQLNTTDTILAYNLKSIRANIDRETRLTRELANLSNHTPINPGTYTQKILTDQKTLESNVTLSKDENGYHLHHNDLKTKISEDGVYFNWTSGGYGEDHHIARVINDSIVGRTFYYHGTDIGMEHFTIRPIQKSK